MSVPKYRKHSSGQARVVINGKCFYLGKHGSKASKQRYDALVAEWLASGRSKSYGVQECQITMDQFKPVEEILVAETLSFCSPVMADMIRVQLLTGCRPVELCKLTPAMIDRSGRVWQAKLLEHKTAHPGRERTVYIGPEAQKIILPYLLRGENDNLFSPAESNIKRRAALAEQRKIPKFTRSWTNSEPSK